MILAFIFDAILSNFFYGAPLLTLLTLIFIYQHKNQYLYVLIFGLLYDVIYTDTLFLNASLFFVSLLLIKRYFKYLKFTLLNVLIISFLLIVLYRIVSFLILFLLGYISFDYMKLLIGIIYSLPNMIYPLIVYLVNNYIYRK